jgi:hypothetical protein
MFDYDAALKIQLKGSAAVTIRAPSGLAIKRWHDVELTTVEERRVDLLGESGDGRLLYIELQSTNVPSMALRIVEYGVRVASFIKRAGQPVVWDNNRRPGDIYRGGNASYRGCGDRWVYSRLESIQDRSDGCIAVELREANEHVRSTGKPAVRAREGGVAL